jgi:hypothetical protein
VARALHVHQINQHGAAHMQACGAAEGSALLVAYDHLSLEHDL